MEDQIFFNGAIVPKSKWWISPDSRAFKYGDGCFETIHMINGNIILAGYHFDRLFISLNLLKFSLTERFDADKLSEEIYRLAKLNNHLANTRIRVTFYRGEGGLYDVVNHEPNYIIQTWALDGDVNKFNDTGLVIDFFTEGSKSPDTYSAIKSNNFLTYTMGALWAKQNKLNDAIVLNSFGSVADTTFANIFIIKDDVIYTPPLTDGCINGVMRRYILECLQHQEIQVAEQSITREDFLEASEIFLTNAIYGIRWVRQVKDTTYSSRVAESLHKRFISTIFK